MEMGDSVEPFVKPYLRSHSVRQCCQSARHMGYHLIDIDNNSKDPLLRLNDRFRAKVAQVLWQEGLMTGSRFA